MCIYFRPGIVQSTGKIKISRTWSLLMKSSKSYSESLSCKYVITYKLHSGDRRSLTLRALIKHRQRAMDCKFTPDLFIK